MPFVGTCQTDAVHPEARRVRYSGERCCTFTSSLVVILNWTINVNVAGIGDPLCGIPGMDNSLRGAVDVNRFWVDDDYFIF